MYIGLLSYSESSSWKEYWIRSATSVKLSSLQPKIHFNIILPTLYIYPLFTFGVCETICCIVISCRRMFEKYRICNHSILSHLKTDLKQVGLTSHRLINLSLKVIKVLDSCTMTSPCNAATRDISLHIQSSLKWVSEGDAWWFCAQKERAGRLRRCQPLALEILNVLHT
jgi:hypothetical protein